MKKIKNALVKIAIVMVYTLGTLLLLVTFEFWCVAISRGASGGPILELIGCIYPDFKKPQPSQLGDCPPLTPSTIETPQPCNGGCLASEKCLGQNGLTCDCAEWDPIDPAQCMKYERCDCILHGSGAAKLRISLPEGGNVYIKTANEYNLQQK